MRKSRSSLPRISKLKGEDESRKWRTPKVAKSTSIRMEMEVLRSSNTLMKAQGLGLTKSRSKCRERVYSRVRSSQPRVLECFRERQRVEKVIQNGFFSDWNTHSPLERGTPCSSVRHRLPLERENRRWSVESTLPVSTNLRKKNWRLRNLARASNWLLKWRSKCKRARSSGGTKIWAVAICFQTQPTCFKPAQHIPKLKNKESKDKTRIRQQHISMEPSPEYNKQWR